MMKTISPIFVALLLLTSCGKKGPSTQPVQISLLDQAATEVVATGRVEPQAKITAIGSQVNGIVNKLYVHEGDTVKYGQVLVELAHGYEDSQLEQAKSKLATQKAEIENVRAQLASTKLKTENLRVRLQRIKNLVLSNAETQQNLDNAQTDYNQSVTDTDRYTAALNSENAKLNERGTDVDVIKAQIAQKKINAPSDGVILDMDITEGAAVTTAKSLFDFAPVSRLTVLCEVDELLADKVKIGQNAYFRNQGSDQKLGTGRVIYTGPFLKKKSLFSDDSGNMEDRRVREVRIVVNESSQLLYGARVEAVINIR